MLFPHCKFKIVCQEFVSGLECGWMLGSSVDENLTSPLLNVDAS